MTANTSPAGANSQYSSKMTTSLAGAPYWTEIDRNKRYNKVLFKPTLALQSRELNELQVLLQDQIARLGSHLFQEGTRVKGGDFNYNNQLAYIKIKDLNPLGDPVDVDNYLGAILTGATTSLKAEVVAVADGVATNADTKTLFVVYNYGNNTNPSVKAFSPNENLTASNGFTATVINDSEAVGYGSSFSISSGLIFAHDHLVLHEAQSLILERYSSAPSYRVGFTITEDILNVSDDVTLADPANASTNYTAPGADRLRFTATLTKLALDADVPLNYVALIAIKDGVIQSANQTTSYADILDEFARRTFDESGDYVVKGMGVTLREHLDNGENAGLYTEGDGGDIEKLIASVAPGTAYIKGYDFSTLVSENLPIDKGLDTKFQDSVQIQAAYGSYLIVNEAVGSWDVVSGSQVSIYNAAQQRITNKTGATSSQTGSLIGKARVRAVQLASGTPGSPTAQYYLFVYDLTMTGGSLDTARSVFIDHGNSTYAGADIVLETDNTAKIYSSNGSSVIFPLTTNATKTIRAENGTVNLDYQFYKGFDVTIATNGTFSLTSVTDEPFPYSAGVLTSLQAKSGFMVTLNAAATTANLTGTVTVSNANGTVTGSGTSFTTALSVGDHIQVGSDIRRVTAIASNTSLTVDSAFSGSASGQNWKKAYLAGSVLDLGGNGGSGTTRTVTVNSSTSVSFDLKETLSSTVAARVVAVLQKTNIREKKKTLKNSYVRIRCSTNTANTVGPYDLGFSDIFKVVSVRKDTSDFTSSSQGTDVTDSFLVSSGQRRDVYDHGQLLPNGISLTNSDYLLISLQHFDQDTSQGDGYFTVDSYPIDDVNSANTSAIMTCEIPVVGGIDLRNALDCRPRFTNTATASTTVSGSTLNPVASTTLVTSSNGLQTPAVDTYFNFDLTYYLPRRDLVTLNKHGKFSVVRGLSSQYPVTPSVPTDSMALAELFIAPYPSLTAMEAANYNRPDLGCIIRKLSNRVYTMRDIGVLDKRISNLEKYVQLSLLEKDTADMQILDANGLDRFKNGFVVDPFTSHALGDVYNVDYACAIDPKRKELRPEASVHQTALQFSTSLSSNVVSAPADITLTLSAAASGWTVGETVYQGANLGSATATGVLRHAVGTKLYVEETTGTWNAGAVKGATSAATGTITGFQLPVSGPVFTLPYRHVVFAQQPFATTTRNAAGLEWSWMGQLDLVPNEDVWTDTSYAPNINVSDDGDFSAWQARADAWGTQWGSWNTFWTGDPVVDVQTSVTGGSGTDGGFSFYDVTAPQRWTGADARANVTAAQSTGNQAWVPAGVNPFKFRGWGWRDTGQSFTTPTTVTVTTTTTPSSQIRTGVSASVVSTGTTSEVTDSHVISTNIQPYMRARRILIRAHGLKPNARFYPFFDGENVSAFCSPVDINGWDYFASWNNYVEVNSPIVLNADGLYTPPPPTEGTSYSSGQLLTSLPSWFGSWVGAKGGSLVADATGRLLAFFDLPCDDTKRFAFGTKVFRLSDSSTNSSVVGQVTSSAQANYTAQGLQSVVQNTITSTQHWDLAYNTVTETRNSSSSSSITTETPGQTFELYHLTYVDPIAQSIFTAIDGNTAQGMYITKLDLYLQTKDENLPLIVMIREMDNSASIGQRIVPYSKKVVYPSEINVSDDGSVATPITFEAPVFLQAGRQYAIVVLPGGGNPNYNVWTSKLGQTDLATGQRVIHNPYVGDLWVSSNDVTYAPVQDEDLKFTLYRADFDTEVTGTAVLTNNRREYLRVNTPTAAFSGNQEQVRGPITMNVSGQVGSASIGDYVWGDTSDAYGQIVTNPTTGQYVLKEYSTAKQFVIGETLTFKDSSQVATGTTGTVGSYNLPVGWKDFFSAATGDLVLTNVADTGFEVGDTVHGQSSGAHAQVLASTGQKYSTIQPQIRQLVFADTTLDWSVKGVSSALMTLDSGWTNVVDNADFDFPVEKILLSASLEDSELSGARSLQVRGVMTTDNSLISPAVDVTGSGAILVYNIVNNDATGETEATGGNALARYITRTITLEDDQDSEDIRIQFAGYQPPSTTIKVYAKIKHYQDGDEFKDRPWIELEATQFAYSSISNKNDFKDTTYGFPASIMTGSNGEVQYTNSEGITFTGYRSFAIKIVMLSGDTAVPPRAKDFRGIAMLL